MEPCCASSAAAGYLKKDVDNYGLLKLTAAGKRFMKSPESFMIVMDKEFKTDDVDECMVGGTSVADPELYAMLKDLRKHLARKLGIPAYVIFQDPSLDQMAMMYPVTEEELQTYKVLVLVRQNDTAKSSVNSLKKYCKEKNIERPRRTACTHCGKEVDAKSEDNTRY